jgi:hypothetical protein
MNSECNAMLPGKDADELQSLVLEQRHGFL